MPWHVRNQLRLSIISEICIGSGHATACPYTQQPSRFICVALEEPGGEGVEGGEEPHVGVGGGDGGEGGSVGEEADETLDAPCGWDEGGEDAPEACDGIHGPCESCEEEEHYAGEDYDEHGGLALGDKHFEGHAEHARADEQRQQEEHVVDEAARVRKGEHVGNPQHVIDDHGQIDQQVAEEPPCDGCCSRGGYAEGVNAAIGAAALCPAPGEHGDAEDEALLEDEHEDTGDDEGGEALRGVADKHGVGADGGAAAHGGICRRAYYIYSLLAQVAVNGYLELGEVEEQGAVAQQQGGIAVEADDSLLGASDAAVIVTRYLYDGVAVMGGAPLAGFGERRGVACHARRGERVDGTRQLARSGSA